MKIDILSLFPEMFEGVFNYSIIDRAIKNNLADIKIHDIRNWGIGERRNVDDRPYGGGVGMILAIEPIYNAINKIKIKKGKTKIILMSASGKKFTQEKAFSYSKIDQLIIICGRYEGVDERVAKHLCDEEISIGDYVLTGGEIPAMAITDAVVRLIPNAIPKSKATEVESFSNPKLLEYPQFTRPEEFNGWKVPKVLLTGNHQEIEKWRKEQSEIKTKKNRIDLIDKQIDN